jgi:hypothetical protein
MLRAIRWGAFVAAATIFGVPAVAHADDVMQNVGKACKGDGARLCPDMKPGSVEYIQCIKQNKEQLSPNCKDAVRQMKEQKRQQQEQQQGAMPQQ